MIKVEIEHGEVVNIREYDNKFKYTILYVRDSQRLKRFNAKQPKTDVQIKVVFYGNKGKVKKGDTLNIRGYLDSDPRGYRIVAQHIKILQSKKEYLF